MCVFVLCRLQVYPLHSTVTLEEQNEVFLVPVPGYRKVIVGRWEDKKNHNLKKKTTCEDI